MRSRSKGRLGFPRLLIIATVLGALTVVPFPAGKSAVEAWSEDADTAPGGMESAAGGAQQVPDSTGLVAGPPSQQAAGDYGSDLDGRRTSLIALLVGMLAVLVTVRWHLSVRGRQHYPRS